MDQAVAEIIRREHRLIYDTRPQELTEYDWAFLRYQGIINGCGAKTGPFANFRPPCSEFFEASCDWHDHGYKKGGGFLRKFEVDYKFFAAMVRDIFGSCNPWTEKLYYLGWSFLYYLAVTIFGWSCYSLRLF